MAQKLGIITLLKKTYLAHIEDSPNSQSFRHFWAEVDGIEKDVVNNGELSCAYFVSSILVIFGFIKRIHATAERTIADMLDSGWYEIKKPRPGCVIYWDKNGQEFPHKHLGFYISNDQAVSNRDEARTPIKHHWTYEGKRKIIALYWSDKITEKLIF